ncbi:MAG: hypothetical protein WBD07_11010 [Vicinamibacterales bacterium]
MTRFGVLAYGPKGRFHREAAVALLTIQAHAPAGSELVVLTDHPRLYQWFGNSITVDRLTPATLAEWRGPHDDRFRPKIEALRRLAADATADVVLVDTDTMARRDLTPLTDRLADGAVFLYRREYGLAAPPRKGDRSLAREIAGRTWQGILAGPDAAMWNGGIVASSRRHRGIFDRTLAAFDDMRVATRHFAVEQLAYSIVFPAYGSIETAAPWFDHYWDSTSRDRFDRAIERFLSLAALGGVTPADARDFLRLRPIVGPLDARAPWWAKPLRKLVSGTDPDDDVSRFREP